ncbi:multiple inositol polyphosphate phosphatase 1-like [Lycorma delicatula]|uniref:multiple inositol polyphosphate phosphatase 1-like n=1 Tax=Lycorma delicatula TaxID=130591 RepID=UPI003F517807
MLAVLLTFSVDVMGNVNSTNGINNAPSNGLPEEKPDYETYCYAEDKHPYTLFSSKTPYQTNMADPPPPLVLPNCTLIQTWTLVRHGTRFAGRPELKYLYYLKTLRDNMLLSKSNKMCKRDQDNLRAWDFYGTPDMHNILMPQGYEEVKKLGQRFRQRFSEFYYGNYSRDQYHFSSSLARRAVHSGYAFVDGMFGEDVDIYFPQPDEYDPVLSGYKHCPKFEKAFSDDNPKESQKEYVKFINSDIMKKLIHEVSVRIGLHYDLEFSILQYIYFMCAYDNSWTVDKISPWCAVFTKEHLKILEFSEDLYYYYKLGYGMDMNQRLGCPPIRDMFMKLNDTVNRGGIPEKKAYFYFSHSGLFQRMTAKLGMFKDPYPIIQTSYINKTRKWRSSFIDPFGSSFSAFLYKCNNNNKYQVVFYVNERVWHFDYCEMNGVCPWDMLIKRWNPEVAYENCNTEFCHEDELKENKHPHTSLLKSSSTSLISHSFLSLSYVKSISIIIFLIYFYLISSGY